MRDRVDSGKRHGEERRHRRRVPVEPGHWARARRGVNPGTDMAGGRRRPPRWSRAAQAARTVARNRRPRRRDARTGARARGARQDRAGDGARVLGRVATPAMFGGHPLGADGRLRHVAHDLLGRGALLLHRGGDALVTPLSRGSARDLADRLRRACPWHPGSRRSAGDLLRRPAVCDGEFLHLRGDDGEAASRPRRPAPPRSWRSAPAGWSGRRCRDQADDVADPGRGAGEGRHGLAGACGLVTAAEDSSAACTTCRPISPPSNRAGRRRRPRR